MRGNPIDTAKPLRYVYIDNLPATQAALGSPSIPMSWFTRFLTKKMPEPDGYVRLDFTHTFPHVVWVSSIGYDERSPEGFRYKALTMRHEPEMIVELVLLRESINGTKTIVTNARGSIDKFAAIDEMIRQLGEGQSVTFTRFDLSDLRTPDDFSARAIEIGWEPASSEEEPAL
jgi:hypothetical protein